MKKITFCFFLISAIGFSQLTNKNGLGIHAGINNFGTYNFSSIEGDEHNANFFGSLFGVGYNIKLPVLPLGITSELNLINVNSSIKKTPILNSTPEYTKYTRYYLSIPLLVKWYIGPINLFCGPQISHLLYNKHSDETGHKSDLKGLMVPISDNSDESVSKFSQQDYAAVFGVGRDGKNIYWNLRATISFNAILSKEYITETDYITAARANRYFSAQLFVGYRF